MGITQTLRGDATGAVKAVKDLNDAIDKYEANLKESVKEAKNLDQAARRIAENVNPQQKYNNQMEKLAKLVKSGRLELSDAEKQAAKYQQQVDRAGKSGDNTFGANAVRQLRNYALGWIGVQQAVNLVKAAMDEANKAGQEAAAGVLGGLGARGELQQLPPAQQQAAEQFAQRALGLGIFGQDQQDAAYRMAFDLENAGYSHTEKNLLLRAGSSGIIRSESLPGIGSQLRKYQDIFGAGEAGNLESVLDKLTYAANESLSDLTTVAKTVPDYAANAKALGFADEESVAAFIAVEKRTKDASIASTNLKNLFQFLEREDAVVNQDLTDTISSFKSRVESGENLAEMVPDAQARAAARDLMSSLPFVNQLDRDLQTKAAGLFSRQSGSLAATDPVFAAGLNRRRALGQLAVSRESNGVAERQLLFEAAAANQRQFYEESLGGFGGAVAGLGQGLIDRVGLEDLYLKMRAESSYTDPTLQKDIRDYLKRTAEASEATADVVKRPKKQTAGRQE